MAPSISSSFKVVTQFKAEYCENIITQYESQRTGLRITTVDAEGPKIRGYFAVATEIHDDSGAPHTLEHLVFMGSRKYRYKGFLDKLASRAFGSTNAWTGNDQTIYTLSSAGWDGFNQLLPVYLDHVIMPTLTDAACYTEVHHVDGTGQDAGVVYSEMQGRENTQSDLMELQRSRLVYGEENGFHYEIGGLMNRLRVLSADKIRSFHAEMYQPKNLCVIIIGKINHTQLLETLARFEDEIIDDVPPIDAPFVRPWTENGKTEPLKENLTKVVEFPEEDEERGELWFSYLGPDYSDLVGRTAISVLLVYLAGSEIALLNNVLVEQENLASSIIYFTEDRPDCLTTISLDGVLTVDLDKVKMRFLNLLSKAASEPLDMSYLQDCLKREERQVRSTMEKDPSHFFTPLINDHLFGRRDGTTLRQLETLDEYRRLETWTEQQWRECLGKWFVNCKWVCQKAVPSMKLSETIQREEENRVSRQKASLGDKGLQELAEKLASAQATNEKDIPQELLEQFEPPGTDSISFINTSTARSRLAQRGKRDQTDAQDYIESDDAESPLFLHFESVPSTFVRVNFILCTHSIPEEQRPLLQLYLENFFDTPVMRNGERVEYEKVQAQLERDTIAFVADTLPFNEELLSFRFNVEKDKYSTVIGWMETLLFDRIFDTGRLITTIKKLLADVPEEKRSGDDMVNQVSDMIHLTRGSSQRAFNTLSKDLYLRKTLYKLEHDPKEVLDKLESIKQVLGRASNIRVSLIADLESKNPLPTPVSAFKSFTDRLKIAEPQLEPIDNPKDSLSFMPGHAAFIIPMRTVDSSFAVLTAKGPESLTDPWFPAYSVAKAYLDAVEGPMWVAVRGSGLAYGTAFSSSETKGLLNFLIYRSPDSFKAFEAAKKTIEDIVTGKTAINQFEFEGALSAAVVNVADEHSNMVEAADRGFAYEAISNVGKDWPQRYLKSVKDVSQETMKAAMKDILLPIFDPREANLVCTCSTTLEERLLKGFRDYGFNVESRALNSFEDDYDLEGDFEGDEGEEGEDDDEDGDDEDEDMQD